MAHPPPYPTGQPVTAPLNAFSAAVKARADARPVDSFDVSSFGFFPEGYKATPRVGIRVPTEWEQQCALAEALKHVHEFAAGVDAIRTDPDVVTNAKNAFIAYAFSREVAETSPGVWEPTGNPAFPAPRWMREHLDPERIAVLVNLANEVRAKQAPQPVEIDDVTVEAYLSLCATHPEPEYGMVGCTREYVVQLLILGAVKLAKARGEVERMAARVAELEAAAAAPQAPA